MYKFLYNMFAAWALYILKVPLTSHLLTRCSFRIHIRPFQNTTLLFDLALPSDSPNSHKSLFVKRLSDSLLGCLLIRRVLIANSIWGQYWKEEEWLHHYAHVELYFFAGFSVCFSNRICWITLPIDIHTFWNDIQKANIKL